MPRKRIGPNSNRRHKSRKSVTGKNGHHDHSKKEELSHMLIDNKSKINNPKSPLKKGGRGWDRVQTGLSVAGLGLPQADALNALISGGRAAYAGLTGDKAGLKKHISNAGINALAILPGAGEVYKATVAGKLLKATKKSNQVADALKIKNIGSTAANAMYWKGTGDQISDDIKGKYDEEEKITTTNAKKKKRTNTVPGVMKNFMRNPNMGYPMTRDLNKIGVVPGNDESKNNKKIV